MARTTSSAEELFRFAATRAPDPLTPDRRELISPEDMGLPSLPVATDFDDRASTVITDLKKKAGVEVQFENLIRLARMQAVVDLAPIFQAITRIPQNERIIAVNDLWKFLLEGLWLRASTSLLEQLRCQLATMSLLDHVDTSKVGCLTGKDLEEWLYQPLRLPAKFVKELAKARADTASAAESKRDESRKSEAAQFNKAKAELDKLIKLEQELASAAGLASSASAKPFTANVTGEANSPLAIRLNLSNAFGGFDWPGALIPNPGGVFGPGGLLGPGGPLDPVLPVLFPKGAAGTPEAPAVPSVAVTLPAEDPNESFRTNNPALIKNLATAGIAVDRLSAAQMLDALEREIALAASQLRPVVPMGELDMAISNADPRMAPVLRRLQDLTLDSQPAVPSPIATLPGIRPLGVADLRVVKQVLIKYEKGELAHVENVMAGETRERTHRRLQKTDETIFSSIEKETENSRDTQSTDRYEVSREARNTSHEETKMSAGVKVTATYGVVSVEATADFSTQRTADQSLTEAQKQSHEVVNRAVEKVRERVLEERTRKVLLEIEETAKHTQTAPGKDHIVGQYRWIDKVYRAQIFNYGARAMYEVMVPQPAAMFKYLLANRQNFGGLLGKQPQELKLKPADITPFSWITKAEEYGVSLPPPPINNIVEFATAVFPSKDNDKGVASGTFNSAAALEKGYQTRYAGCSMSWYGVDGKSGILASIGTALFKSGSGDIPVQHFQAESSAVSFNALGYGLIYQYSVNFELVWERTSHALQKWQLECYNIILEDYEKQVLQYQERVASARVGMGQLDTQMTDVQMRAIERNELKRGVLEIARSGKVGPPPAMVIVNGIPQINTVALKKSSEEVRFFENAFEWDQITYAFHPYFWSDEAKTWDASLFQQKGDPVFSSFLSAGYASVVLPVRKEFIDAVAVYFQTGLISSMPAVPADELLRRMNAEVLLRSASSDQGMPEGEAWTYQVPTTLVILDESTKPVLPDFSASIGKPVRPYVPSDKLCGGKPYNIAEWPDADTVVQEMRRLGYQMPFGEAQLQLVSPIGNALVKAFQEYCNVAGIAKSVNGTDLKVDGAMGPCSLRALSASRMQRNAGEWSGPTSGVR